MTPGPTPIPAEVSLAGAKPIIHHRAPVYTEVFLSVIKGLKEIFKTKNDVLIFTSSGTGVMESSIVNSFSPGDKVIATVGGNFGERFASIAEVYGLQVQRIEYEWDEAIKTNDIRKALQNDPEIKGVLAVHSETSTGVVNDIEALGQITKDHQALLMVDTVSSLGALDFRTDEWNVDIAFSGSQKALMSPPGLGFVAISKKAWEAIKKSKLPKFYFSYEKSLAALKKPTPQNPFTPAIATMFSLCEAIKLIKDEELENIFKRHKFIGEALRAGIKALNLEMFPKNYDKSNVVTAIKAPKGIDGGEIVKIMREKYGITIAGGQSKLKGKIFRIGHVGYYDKFDIISVLSALEMCLAELNYPLKLGSAVKAAEEIFQKG